jgi:hypothetical protein
MRLVGFLSFRFLLLAVTLPALAHGSSPTPPISLRAFAVGNKVEVRYADTYQSFHDKMFALVDGRHPRRGELVQAGVDDVASHLAAADASAPALALVNFPEDVGLVAGLIGTRGAAARRANIANGGSVAAFGSLIQKYDPQIGYYSELWPGLPAVRYLLLAETDTFYRACYETFRDLARTYGVYVSATFNVAPARRVNFTDDPTRVGLLRDPDEAATRDYAYIATSPEVYNATFLFDPDGNIVVGLGSGVVGRSPTDTNGELRASWRKAYLTEPEQDTLPLAYGSVHDLDVLDTPIGRIASLISKDAWMIDVNDRLDAKGAELIIQPEAFSEWAYVATPWQPDGFKAGGFAQVQRNPSYRYNVTPSLTGNLFEVTFDGQSAVTGKRQKPATVTSEPFIGQNNDPGFLRVGPWIRDDPHGTLTLQQRRNALAIAGQRLLPGARPRCTSPLDFGACENGYRESVLFADLRLGGVAPPATTGTAEPTAFGSSRRVDAGDSPARWARVAADAGRVYVVWQDSQDGFDSIVLGISDDRGQHFREKRVSADGGGAVHEMRPALAFNPGTGDLFVVWQEQCVGLGDHCGHIKLARFDRNGEKIGGDVRVDSVTGQAEKWNPSVAVTKTGNPLVSWVDERDETPQGLKLEHIYFARGRNRGAQFFPEVRVDRGPPVTAAASLDNKWSPSIALWGHRIYIAWTDFRNYNWDIFLASSMSGRLFSPNIRIDDFVGLERLHDHPSVASDDRGVVHVAWADRRAVDSDTNVMYARSTDGGHHVSPNQRIDSSEQSFDVDQDTPSNQWAPRLTTSGADVFVVWQDNRLGDNDIFWARSQNRGLTFNTDERVDDSGSIPSDQYRPDIAVDEHDADGRVVYVVWEDDREGGSHIALVHRVVTAQPSLPLDAPVSDVPTPPTPPP